jgi:hypothetical protein
VGSSFRTKPVFKVIADAHDHVHCITVCAYFMGLIFAVNNCLSTKIGPLENFPLYSHDFV